MRTRKYVAFGLLAALAAPTLAQAAMSGLSPASGYNVFVLNNLNVSNSDSYGRIAVGNNATFSSYSVNSKNASGNSLIVGGMLSTTYGTLNGNVIVGANASFNGPTVNGTLDVTGNISHTGYGTFNGNVTASGNITSDGYTSNSALRTGGSVNFTNNATVGAGIDAKGDVTIKGPNITGGIRSNGAISLTGGGGSVDYVKYATTYSGPNSFTQTKVSNSAVVPAPTSVSSQIDFAASLTYFRNASTSWATQSANGTNSLAYGNRTLTGTNSSLNIFNLSASDFNSIYSFAINVPTGSTVLINVAGTAVSLPNIGWTLNGSRLDSEGSGASYGSVLWNFSQATTLSHYSLGGAILAPYASVTFNNGQFNGTEIAYDLTGTGESHDYQFTGNLPLSVSGGGSSIPEPSSMLLLPAAGLLLSRRRRR